MHIARLAGRLGALYRALRSGGFRRVAMTARLWMLSADDRRFEDRYQLDTRSHVELDAFDVEPEKLASAFSYAPAPGRIVHHLFDSIPLDPARMTFVDFGSGKGRVLLLASLRGFRHAVGVEFSPNLVEMARQNAERFARLHPAKQSIDINLGDAGEFAIPPGDCLLHFNNPFNEEVMQRVLQNVEQAISESPRRIWLAYQQLRPDLEDSNSENLELLAKTPFLQEAPLQPMTRSQQWLFGCHTVKLFAAVSPGSPRKAVSIETRDLQSLVAMSPSPDSATATLPRCECTAAE